MRGPIESSLTELIRDIGWIHYEHPITMGVAWVIVAFLTFTIVALIAGRS